MRKTPLRSSRPISFRNRTRVERKMGRLMRAPDGHEDASQAGGDDNTTGKEPPAKTESGGNNNTGEEFDPSTFFDEDGDGTGGSPSGESDGSLDSLPSATDVATDINKTLTSMKFEDLMTTEMLESFNTGDVKSFNEGLQTFGQTVAKNTLMMTVGLMKHMRTTVLAEARELVSGGLNADKNYEALVKAIPSAGKKEMGGTIRGIYDKALTRAKGNRDTAIVMTKEVLKLQAEMFGGDLGLNVAPQSADDRHTTPPKTTNWLEELSSR